MTRETYYKNELINIDAKTVCFLLIENKEASDNAEEKEPKSMFPRPFKHKLCCLRPELIEGFIA